LAGLALFEGCSRRELDAATSLLTEIVVEPGTVLIHEGTAAREAFILGDGSARVVQGRGDTARELGVVGAGAPLGELAILDNEPRMATVTTLTRTRLYVATPGEFTSLLRRVPAVEARVLETARQRRQANAA
jgi:CRP-like cAMP-binding protein